MHSQCGNPNIEPPEARAEMRESVRTGISWVIPVRNESSSVKELVEGISRQTLQPDEVIIVDGGSGDDTVARLKELTVDLPCFSILEVDQATPGKGRNIGIEAARYDWIALTDAGTRIPANWLEEFSKVREQHPEYDVIYGHYEPIMESRFDEWASLAYVPAPLERGNGAARGPSTASMILRRSVWEQIGGFPDLRASEDRLFMEQIEKQNFSIGWAPNAVTYWHIQHDYQSTFRRFYLYSMHNVWAGRQNTWHYGVLRIYSVMALFMILAILIHPAWVLGATGIWIARVYKMIWSKRGCHSIFWTLNPIRFAGVSTVLLILDTAMFSGWLSALLKKNRSVSTPQDYLNYNKANQKN